MTLTMSFIMLSLACLIALRGYVEGSPCAGRDDPASVVSGTTLQALVASSTVQLPQGEVRKRRLKALRLGKKLINVIKSEQFRGRRLRKLVDRLNFALDMDISTYTNEPHITEDARDIHQTLRAFEKYVDVIVKNERSMRRSHKRTQQALEPFRKSLRALRCTLLVDSDKRGLGRWKVPRELLKVKDGAFRSLRDLAVITKIVDYLGSLGKKKGIST